MGSSPTTGTKSEKSIYKVNRLYRLDIADFFNGNFNHDGNLYKVSQTYPKQTKKLNKKIS